MRTHDVIFFNQNKCVFSDVFYAFEEKRRDHVIRVVSRFSRNYLQKFTNVLEVHVNATF